MYPKYTSVHSKDRQKMGVRLVLNNCAIRLKWYNVSQVHFLIFNEALVWFNNRLLFECREKRLLHHPSMSLKQYVIYSRLSATISARDTIHRWSTATIFAAVFVEDVRPSCLTPFKAYSPEFNFETERKKYLDWCIFYTIILNLRLIVVYSEGLLFTKRFVIHVFSNKKTMWWCF